MKKLLMAALVLGLVFSLAQVTVADERVKFDGHIRTRAYYIDLDDSANGDSNVQQYTDFRFRLGGRITVAEGITGNFRIDFQDNSKWGWDTSENGRAVGGSVTGTADLTTGEVTGSTSVDKRLTVERAFIRIEKDMFILQAGQIFQAFGELTAYTPQSVGYALRLKLPVTIDLNYMKLSEGSALTDGNDSLNDADKDQNLYGAQVTYNADGWRAGGYYALEDNGSKVGFENRSVIGLFGGAKIGPVALKATLDMLGGTKNDAVDYMGTQAWLNGQMALGEPFVVGADVYYAAAASDDGSEEQIVRIADRAADVPMDKYAVANRLGRWSDIINPLNNGFPTAFEKQANAGMTAFDLYGFYNLSETLSFALSAGYFMPADSDWGGAASEDWESSILFVGSVLWEFAPRCDLFGGFYHRTDDYDNDVSDEDPDAEMAGYAGLRISW